MATPPAGTLDLSLSVARPSRVLLLVRAAAASPRPWLWLSIALRMAEFMALGWRRANREVSAGGGRVEK